MNSASATFFQKHERLSFIFQAIIFIAYVFVRVLSTLPALHAPRELADTSIYVRISTQSILGQNFLQVNRPFVFPFLLQIVHRDFALAAGIQLGLTILAWGWLAYCVSISFRLIWLRILSFAIILALSLVRHLAGWDFVMMTESLSLSTFVLLIACGIWLLRGWQIHKVMILCIVAFVFAFTRDTNAYLLIMFAGLLLIAVLFRWASPKILVLVGAFALIFFVSNLSANTSKRWVFPLVNVVGKRILPYSESVQRFEACGMPVTPELLGLADTFANGEDRAFFNDPALEGFRVWIADHGKSCYIHWLVTEPLRSIGQAFSEFTELVYFEDVNKYFSRHYTDLLPSRVERVLYPVYYVTWLWAGLTIAALAALIKQLWRDNNLWAVFIMLCLTIFPHLFITWHGDAMAPNRHAVSVGMQLAITMWLFIFLMLERAELYFIKESKVETTQ
jgi:hypothetical protein